jgi:hypothetical protein
MLYVLQYLLYLSTFLSISSIVYLIIAPVFSIPEIRRRKTEEEKCQHWQFLVTRQNNLAVLSRAGKIKYGYQRKFYTPKQHEMFTKLERN